jgi:hypothetical protein
MAHVRRMAGRFRGLPAAYSSLTGETWALDWQLKKDFWLGLIETLIRCQQDTGPARPWRAKIAADPAAADWYRLGYLAALYAGLDEKVEQDKRFDYGLVRPWVEVPGQPTSLQLRRMCPRSRRHRQTRLKNRLPILMKEKIRRRLTGKLLGEFLSGP